MNVPAIIIVLALGVYLVVYFIAVNDEKVGQDWNVLQIELELELAQEKKRFHATTLNLDLQARQQLKQPSEGRESVQ